MFDELFVKKLKKTIIFILIYTILFALFFSTISYTLPFVLALVIAIWTKPLASFFKKKFKIPKGISALASTVIVITLGIFIITIILFNLTIEAKTLLTSMPDVKTISQYIYEHVDNLKLYYYKIDPSLAEKLHQQIFSVLSGTVDITVKILNKIISIAIGLPVFFMIIFITLLTTYFFSKDIELIENKIFSIFSIKGKEKMGSILKESNRMFSGYIKAYLTIISITFIETFIGFSILRIDYALILSLVAASVDVLPILGVGSVYIPLAIINYFMGNYVVSIGLIILYVLVAVIRQIIEPKLVATSLGVYPIAILASIFIGLKAYGFLGMIYLIFLIIFYNIFKKSDVL